MNSQPTPKELNELIRPASISPTDVEASNLFSTDQLNGLIQPETARRSDSDNSRKESKALYGGDERRLEGLKEVMHWAILLTVRIASLTLLVLFLIRIYHLAMPENLLWLGQDRMQKIDCILFSGFLGAFVARYLNQATPKNGDHGTPS
ncbi:hypothetical protein KUF54_03100 [Comamonas sp. Y33R10-2]|uniref:hypothetical protein n=1 Tax=Comamonas sp. Y33R10-2 TaxID=2853257 RepID=UPI001C5C98B5|nr:hypothetical protein [Comamonas sp. Y33R10-2]QXZ10260.1 hypothetical protein KUF54_03100 [Comamonas sp. Y33R10-2]